MEQEYRISTGDVERGDVGFCFSVIADSEENAIEKVRQAVQALNDTQDGGIEIDDSVMPKGLFAGHLLLDASRLTVNNVSDIFPLGR